MGTGALSQPAHHCPGKNSLDQVSAQSVGAGLHVGGAHSLPLRLSFSSLSLSSAQAKGSKVHYGQTELNTADMAGRPRAPRPPRRSASASSCHPAMICYTLLDSGLS